MDLVPQTDRLVKSESTETQTNIFDFDLFMGFVDYKKKNNALMHAFE